MSVYMQQMAKNGDASHSPEGKTGSKCHCIQALRIPFKVLLTIDDAFINCERSWAVLAASSGDILLSSRGGNSMEKDAMASSDN
jgi:hypothetical protein